MTSVGGFVRQIQVKLLTVTSVMTFPLVIKVAIRVCAGS